MHVAEEKPHVLLRRRCCNIVLAVDPRQNEWIQEKCGKIDRWNYTILRINNK